MRYSTSIKFLGNAVLAVSVFAAAGLAQVPYKGSEAPAATTRAPRYHGPMKLHQAHDNGTVDSENWSGFAVTGTSFTKAFASWVVPTANCSVTPGTRTSPTYASFWVGIDGYSSSTVEQTGTDSDCDGTTPTYYAWYEFYPAASIDISTLTVAPGNKMEAEIVYDSGTDFTITIKNATTGKSFTKSGSVSGAERTSAEWIAESPCCLRSGAFLPLADFGTVTFGEDTTSIKGTNSATDSTTSGVIGAFPAADIFSINMVTSGGAAEATTGSLSSDGSSFPVTWDSE